MSKPVILIMSCERDRNNGAQLAAEQTWFRKWDHLIECKFILGRAPTIFVAQPWEIFVDAADGYNDVPKKFELARRWALAEGYDYVFNACVDTWINVPRLLHSGFEGFDYTGYRCDEGHASGGMGFWLSKKALTVVLAADNTGHHWDDLWIGDILRAAGIPLNADPRYSARINPRRPLGQEITFHLSRAPGDYDPEWMRRIHEVYADV